jgi:hypothetical protein
MRSEIEVFYLKHVRGIFIKVLGPTCDSFTTLNNCAVTECDFRHALAFRRLRSRFRIASGDERINGGSVVTKNTACRPDHET